MFTLQKWTLELDLKSTMALQYSASIRYRSLYSTIARLSALQLWRLYHVKLMDINEPVKWQIIIKLNRVKISTKKIMKLAFSLLAGAIIASPTNERLITDRIKCCQRLNVRYFHPIYYF